MRIGMLGAVYGSPESTKKMVGYTLIGLKGAQTMYVEGEGNREGVEWWCFVVEVVVVEAIGVGRGRGREREEGEGARGSWVISFREGRMLSLSLSLSLSRFLSSNLFKKHTKAQPKLHGYGYGIVPDMGTGTRIYHFF